MLGVNKFVNQHQIKVLSAFVAVYFKLKFISFYEGFFMTTANRHNLFVYKIFFLTCLNIFWSSSMYVLTFIAAI